MMFDADQSRPLEQPRRPSFDESKHLNQVLELVDELHRRGRTDVESALREINDVNRHAIPGAQYAGITVMDGSGAVATLGATDRWTRQLDDVQRETNEGPSFSAARHHPTVFVQDLDKDERWPKFRAAALTRTPVRTMLTFRLVGNTKRHTSLSLQADSTGVFDDDAVDAGRMVAAHTLVAWNLIRREQNFRSALASRDVIGQAKGIVMERFDIDATTAFDMLKRLSQDRNTKIVDIAETLVALDHPSN